MPGGRRSHVDMACALALLAADDDAPQVIVTAPDRQAGPGRRYNGNVSRRLASWLSPTVTSICNSPCPRQDAGKA